MDAYLVVGLFIVLFTAVILWLWRMRGRASTTTLAGVLHQVMDQDRRAATEVLIRREAHAKEEEEERGDPEDPAESALR